PRGHTHGALLLQVADGGAMKHQPRAEPAFQRVGGVADVLPHALPHCTQTTNTDVDDERLLTHDEVDGDLRRSKRASVPLARRTRLARWRMITNTPTSDAMPRTSGERPSAQAAIGSARAERIDARET